MFYVYFNFLYLVTYHWFHLVIDSGVHIVVVAVQLYPHEVTGQLYLHRQLFTVVTRKCLLEKKLVAVSFFKTCKYPFFII